MKKIIPKKEITTRIERFQKELNDHEIDLALIRQNADLFYLTGTMQDAHLFVPREGSPLFLVWRVFERATQESPLDSIEPLPSLSSLPEILRQKGLLDCKNIGLELDSLPANLYLYYKERLWHSSKFMDITPHIRTVRAVKSDWEIQSIKATCRQVKEVVDLVPDILKPGIRELELSSTIEAELRKRGHPGYLRMRGWNQEMGSCQVLSGSEAAAPSWTITPAGGRGTSPGYGLGACHRIINPFEPVGIDIGGSLNGYLCDQTRLFCLSGLPGKLSKAFEDILDFHQRIAEWLVPGAVCSDIYDWCIEEIKRLGYRDFFMGYKENQVRFIGHGLGVEIDEYPFLSMRNPMSLSNGMVVAVEPKLIFPDHGMVGVEDTYLITPKGAERLTLSPQDLTIC